MSGSPEAGFNFGGEVVWRPDREILSRSNLLAFIRSHNLNSLPELQHQSTTELSWFWIAVLQDLDIRFRRPFSEVLKVTDSIAWPQWCVGGVMNIVDNCLDKYVSTPVDKKPAIDWEAEDGEVRQLTYAQLAQQVNRMATALRGLGLKQGDVAAVFMPMLPETVVAMLAIIKIGAIFLPLFSGFGPQAIVTRLNDAGAKILFTADGSSRRGKLILLKPIADEAVAQTETIQHVIVYRRSGAEVPWHAGRDKWWHELMTQAGDRSETEPTNADDPMMLIYTSGTTGRPKGTVHSHCGFPVKAAQDIKQGLDLHPDENLFWVTDMGWMMGPWLVFGTLLLGATMTIYDGVVDFPEPDRLWSLVERHRVTCLGISPTLVRALIQHGTEPVRRHELPSLRKFGSTGEPWNPDPWLWLFHEVGHGRLPILNYSGGTEISGGIIMGNVLSPLKPCSFAGPVPGMAADVVNENGKSIRGEVGELIIRQPWIGMTRGFWGDPQRYLETYWSRFPGVWTHGDWAAVDRDGFWYILGRSDDTIKVAGKRIGPAEVESILVNHPAVSEAAVIGLPDQLKGEALACFCVLKPGREPDDRLRDELKLKLMEDLGKTCAPKSINFVHELPKTRNAKVMRRVIRAAYLGQEPGDVSSLENPAAIEEIRSLVDS